ncbi:putative delta-60 repeat protein/predicted secreted protein (Por secretion system target) [Flavobacterium sp. 9]|uniref:T9SS type A sorting domain-containing protein n=1 Tax=Flavobacterium sp. 9 TaxID=2035198 RepID=UPI000C192F48|nr:T9SS type A sorting domain-containing protein [Flavobacterium sp. 9]PIF33648.1 putative delta-60 repeat protein/predicted secreted protein (Por secretion system target) [Flavobacterium sp. 9]
MKKLYSLLLFIVVGILSANAQVVDETFVQPTAYKAAKITVIKELSDGKILLGGNIQFFKEKKVSNLIRLNADYSLDETFVFNGDPKSEIKDVKFQSNGNIIVLTTIDNFGFADYFKLYQLNANGETLKEVSTIFNATAIAVQADDKILVTGGAIGYYDFTSCYLKRFNSDFSLDETFKNDLAFNASTNNVLVSSNGIYVGGLFTAIDGITKNSLVKLNSDGVIDTTFDVGAGANGSAFSMTLQDDGKIIVGGNFSHIVDGLPSNNMCRLNLDGSIDTSFSAQYYNYANSVITIKDSHLYVDAGINDGTTFGYHLIRLKPDGSLDENFNRIKLNEFGGDYFVSSFVNGKIFYNNSEYTGNRYGISISDLEGNAIDASELKPSKPGSFQAGSYFDGKLVVKGDFVKINNVETYGIALLDANGDVDESFVFPTYRGDIKQIQVVNNSVFVGTKTQFINLDANGKLIKDFNFKVDSDLLEIQQFNVFDNGKILLTDQWNLVLLNEQGIQESKFILNSDSNFWITNLRFEMQNDKVLCAGQFESFGAGYRPKSKLMRFNIDKTIDESFNTNVGADGAINRINILDSGEIIIAGNFFNYNNVSVPNQIVKLSKDGEMDLKFNENLSLYHIGYSEYHDYRKIEVIDGVIYITEGDAKVTAINLDGTLKKDFEMPAVIDNITDLVAVENKEETAPKTDRKATLENSTNNYMFAMGTTKSTTGVSSVIVKVNLGKSGSLSVGPTPEKLASKVQVFPVPVQEKLNLSFSTTILPNKISVYSANGKELYTAKVQSADNLEVDMSQFSSGIYFVKLFSDSGVITKKIVKK